MEILTAYAIHEIMPLIIAIVMTVSAITFYGVAYFVTVRNAKSWFFFKLTPFLLSHVLLLMSGYLYFDYFYIAEISFLEHPIG